MQRVVWRVENVTTRMSEDELALVERLAEARGDSRSDAVRQAIRRGAQEELIRVALQRYREGEVGMRGAAEVAGLTIAEMLAEANERGVLANYDAADLADDVDALR
jgi:predicted HTH domain antitoxin